MVDLLQVMEDTEKELIDFLIAMYKAEYTKLAVEVAKKMDDLVQDGNFMEKLKEEFPGEID